MASEAIAAPAPAESDSIAVVRPSPSPPAQHPLSTATATAPAPATAATAATAAPATAASDGATGLYSPPDSNNAVKLDGSDDSELSDLDDAIADQLRLDPGPGLDDGANDDDIGDVEPDHYSGTVPVFKPTMHQFRDFKKFVRLPLSRPRTSMLMRRSPVRPQMTKIDKYGMKSGIVKIVPPPEWKEALPPLDELVKTVRVREPIKQDIMGCNGTYRQVNILHQRSYNLPQWRQLCEQSEHQPPARRGERRANADKPRAPPKPRPAAAAATAAPKPAPPRRGRRGRSAKKKKPQPQTQLQQETADENTDLEARPMTPESPRPDDENADDEDKVVESIEHDPGIKVEEDEDGDVMPPAPRRMGFTRQAAAKTQSTSARRKYAKREGSAMIDEAAFKDWDYRMDVSDYTPERCDELERIYWKTLTYAPPLYGADLPGTLFDEDKTELWNLNKLPNLLDVLGTKVPGVNTAYLYLGMWKATFAWHLEDVDLYSINYLHFGAPKQWYSISQPDARRFEAAMRNIWPTEAKACDQFLRHKAFLISPAHLQQHYNIKVNKCVSYPGEFVVTYPYGYHSGYNLGYNCAEAVNFALDSWLPMGKIAKKCECAQAQDSVWIDVPEIERKLRGESTEYEVTDYEEEDDDDDIEAGSVTGLPTPASGRAVRVRAPPRKRKRPAGEKEVKKVKKIRLRIRASREPCCLCPNDIPGAEILPTDDGRRAHRICALYLPETYIETEDDREIITNVANIEKARLELRCMYCRSKRGACFQCSYKKCARSYHATCAAAAGVFVEEADVPVFGEDGTEYKEQAFEFTCRFQRTKRDRKLDGDALEKHTRTREAARALKKGVTCQLQYYRGDIFAGVVVENRPDEETLLLDVIPNGDRVEVEWKWLLLPDTADFRLPKASPNALPLPTSRQAKGLINAKKRPGMGIPQPEDAFVDGFTWAEFRTCDASECANTVQARLDLAKEKQVWHYLGRSSTELRSQYTEDPANPRHNPESNFLSTLPKLPPKPRQSHTAINPPFVPHSLGAKTKKTDRPYVYKPKEPMQPTAVSAQFVRYTFPANPQLSFGTDPQFNTPGQQHFSAAARPALSMGGAGAAAAADPLRPGVTAITALQGEAIPARSPDTVWMMPSYQPVAAVYSAPTGPKAALPILPPPRPPKQCDIAQPAAVLPQLSTARKYAFFQAQHNRWATWFLLLATSLRAGQPLIAFTHRESSTYKTPYAAWGGFTNGYEGNLRAHLMGAPAVPSNRHRRGSSFNLGGGLKGLVRPSAHLNYSTPPSSSSASPSPYASTLGAAATSPSSYSSSYDTMMGSVEMAPHHRHSPPPQATINPIVTSPVTAMRSFDMRLPGTPQLHPAIRPQFTTASWHDAYHAAVGPFAQGKTPPPGPATSPHADRASPCSAASTDVNFSPPSPIRAGVLAASPSILSQQSPVSYAASLSVLPAFSPPPPKSPPPIGPGTSATPSEQLKQQLRRISDPPLPSSYSVPHPAIRREVGSSRSGATADTGSDAYHQPKRRHQSRSSLNRIYTSQLLDLNPT